jgi:hypothetical protein
MGIGLRGADDHHAVRVEGRRRDGRAAVGMEEPAVRLEGRQLGTVDVEQLHLVSVGAAEMRVSRVPQGRGIGEVGMVRLTLQRQARARGR